MRFSSSSLGPYLIVFCAIACPVGAAEEEDAAGPRDSEFAKLTQLVLTPLAQRADRWICTPTTTRVCSVQDCKTTRPTVRLELRPTSSQYSRCDERGCDDYDAQVSASGIYTIIEAGRATFVKVVNDGSEYVEAASLGTSIVQNFGRCLPVRP